METRDWVEYFEQNKRDRRPVSWHDPVTVPPAIRAALAQLLWWLAQVERRDARRIERWARGRAAALLVAEKHELARLLDRLREHLGVTVAGMWTAPEFLTGPWTVTAAVARAAILMRLYGELRSAVPDPVAGAVCEQVLHDTKFHIRFLCEQRHKVPRVALWGLALWAAAGVWRRHRSLLRAVGVADRDFVPACWANLAAVEAALWAGQPFYRGTAEQVPLLTERRA